MYMYRTREYTLLVTFLPPLRLAALGFWRNNNWIRYQVCRWGEERIRPHSWYVNLQVSIHICVFASTNESSNVLCKKKGMNITVTIIGIIMA